MAAGGGRGNNEQRQRSVAYFLKRITLRSQSLLSAPRRDNFNRYGASKMPKFNCFLLFLLTALLQLLLL